MSGDIRMRHSQVALRICLQCKQLLGEKPNGLGAPSSFIWFVMNLLLFPSEDVVV